MCAYNPKDFYFKKAKERNFVARSVFKIEELDQKFRIFRGGQAVLDLGCAPGSWSQYASLKVGDKGIIIGLDLQRVTLSISNAAFYQGDINDDVLFRSILEEKKIQAFDVVMSDMAPKTSGIRVQDQQRSFDLCMKALEVSQKYLKPGGTLIVKLFQSESFTDFVNELKKHFPRVEVFRPKSTRKASFEVYILGFSYKPLN